MLQKPTTLILFCITLLTACEEPAPVVSSTLITNAVIYNGSGGDAFEGAVRIAGDRIIEIGAFVALEGETVIVASDEEIQQMSELVAADMTAGAIGLATGLEYEPGLYSSTEEVIALSKVVAGFDGRYTSHVRDEDEHFMDAVREAIRIGREAGLPVHIAHIKLADREYWGTSNAVLELLDDAISEGVRVTADIYPYQRWASNLPILFPDRDYSDRSAAEFAFAHTAAPEDIVLSLFSPNPDFSGLSVAEISKITESDPESTLMELAQAADDYFQETGVRGSLIIAKGMDEGDVAALMQWKNTNICSDGGNGGGHPRSYGAFPRVLGHFVRELGVLTLQDATALSVGIEKVWVNGVLAFDQGKPTMAYSGQIISGDSQ